MTLRAAASLWLALALLVTSFVVAAAERVGETTFVQSVASAQQPNQVPRFLQKGSEILEGDVLNTGAKGFALVEFRDGTKITLAPNTTFAVDKLRHDRGEESAGFRLLKGGIRTLTGLIAKRNPPGVVFNAVTATIGIRGTQFDARICGRDCTEDEDKARRSGTTVPEAIIARVAVVSGTASATGAGRDAAPRTLEKGSPLFNGDTIRTQKQSYAVLAFRDESKVTVIADSEFRLDDVRYTNPSANSGNFTVRLVRGGMRAITGLLAKNEPKNVTFRSATATIGIRGTDIDFAESQFCFSASDCAPAFLVLVQEGTIDYRFGERSIVVGTGQTAVIVPSRDFIGLGGVLTIPDVNGPRPRNIEVPKDFFQAEPVAEGPYVAVVDGRLVFCAVGGQCVDVTPGEAFQLRPGADRPNRIQFPSGLQNVPPPWGFNPERYRVLEQLNPGDLICEIR